MKRNYFLGFSALLFSAMSWGQVVPSPTPLSGEQLTLPGIHNPSLGLSKSANCTDTLRYPMFKEALLGTTTFQSMNLTQSGGIKVTMAYLNDEATTINGVELFGLITSGSSANLQITVDICSINSSNNPTGVLASMVIPVNNAAAGYIYGNLATPLTVTGNYALQVYTTSTGGQFTLATNNQSASAYDEDFSRLFLAGNYYPIPAIFGASVNFEPIVAPIVSYPIVADYTPSATAVCLGTEVTFTNTSTPALNLTNRFESFNSFRKFWNLAPTDSTNIFDYDDGNLAYETIPGHTYAAAGSYDATLNVATGFSLYCVDSKSVTITVNPIDDATFTYSNTNICSGGANEVPTVNVTGTFSATPAGLTFANASTGEINPGTSTAGTYTVSYASTGACPDTTSQSITIVETVDATFAYSSNTFCAGGSNEVPTVSNPGTFSVAPAGLIFMSTATGEINIAGSTNGTYTVSYVTTGVCSDSTAQSITITSAPDASFTYAQAVYCSTETDPVPSFGAGASAGTFSSTAGLTINAATGEIDLSASTPGLYTVNNDIAASGSCPAVSETFDVTVKETPTATVSGGGQLCGSGTIPVTVTLTGSGPWDFTYSDGTTPTTVTAQATSPYTINAAANGTYTVTTVDQAGCSANGTGSATVVFNANPTVTFDPLADVCHNASPVNLAATPAGGTFSGSGVVGPTFNPATVGTATITYTYTDGNGCIGTASQDITVNALPVVTLAPLAEVCIYTSPVTLTGGLPAGGTYSGNGVTSGSFNPATAGLGITNITYSYTDGNGCSSTDVEGINVDDCASISEEVAFDVVIAPNPATDHIAITVNGAVNVTYTVLTEDGKVVIAPKALISGVTEDITMSHLARGMYFVQLTSAEGTATKKVILK